MPEDRSQPGGRHISLNIAVIPAADPTPKADPVFLLAGGPGDAATTAFLDTPTGWAELHQSHDFVMVDQRGTGDSGALRLADPPNLAGLDDAAALAAVNAWLPDAIAELPGDPAMYSTWAYADDLDAVRAALGYELIDVLGASYGATAAQIYLAAHPEHIRTVTLTGVTLLDVPVFERKPATAQAALDKVFDRCAADSACSTSFPGLRNVFLSVLSRLDAKPVEVVAVFDSTTGKPVRLDRAAVAGVVYSMTFSPNSAAALPRTIYRASQGDFNVLASTYAQQLAGYERAASLVMPYAVRCSEHWARFDPMATAANGANSYMVDSMVREATMFDTVCSVWPKAGVPALDGQPVHSDKPVLLLVGGADPNNPPENVANASHAYPNSLTTVVPAGGHWVTMTGCVPKLLAQFVDAGSARGIDPSCAASAPSPPFALEP